MIIYNDMKEQDWLAYKGGLPIGTIIVMNNEEYNQDVVLHLTELGYRVTYSKKLCESPSGYCNCLDAENYYGDIDYSAIKTSIFLYPEIMFPEDLGGDKYKGYAEFLLKVMPRIVCMERTYNVWKPWDLLRFWNRNKYLRDKGITVYIGIWPETFPWICQKIQLFFAKLISGNKIFWYSERASLPKI